MRHDPQIEVTCDGCGGSIIWEPTYVYNDWSGTSGHYDTRDCEYQRFLAAEDWEGDGDTDKCGDCLSAEREDDAADDMGEE